MSSSSELANELLIEGFPSIKPLEAKVGRYGGTCAVKELVYAYAMWVSPKFHHAVIRALKKTLTQGLLVLC